MENKRVGMTVFTIKRQKWAITERNCASIVFRVFGAELKSVLLFLVFIVVLVTPTAFPSGQKKNYPRNVFFFLPHKLVFSRTIPIPTETG